MAGYIGANTSSVTNNQNAAERRKKFTFTANTTVLSGLNFAANKIHIFHNGIRLVKDTDFTEATDGKSVTLTNAAQAGDEVVAITFAQDPASSSYTDADVDAHLLTAGVTLDATNDRLGIGTTTPSVPFDVTKAGGGNFVANFQNTTNATPYGIHVKDAASGANGYPLFQVTNDAGSSTYFRVDSGTGRVFMPKNPSFYAKGSGGWYTVSNGSNTQIPFTVTNHNTGSHYDTSTSTFTAPSGGRYMFALGTYGRLQGGQGDNTRYWVTGFLKNNATINANAIVGYQNDGDYDFGYTQTIVVELAANDTMKVYARSSGSYNGEVYRGNCFFCGHMLS